MPGGFYEMVRDILDVRAKPGQEGLSASLVMVYWIVVLSLSLVKSGEGYRTQAFSKAQGF